MTDYEKLSAEVAELLGECPHVWMLTDKQNEYYHTWKCTECKKIGTTPHLMGNTPPPACKTYATDPALAIKALDKLGADWDIMTAGNAKDEPCICVEVTFDDSCGTDTQSLPDHNNDAAIATATAICKAILSVKREN